MQLTSQQTTAVNAFCHEGKNVCVRAVPGAGKSTLIVEICRVLEQKYDAKCLVVAYNTDLAAHMVSLLERNNLNSDCFTFHSLCSNTIQLSPDDISFKVALNNCKDGLIEAKKLPYQFLLIDEAQDMKDAYMELLDLLFDVKPKVFICGDINQMLYDFDPDSSANTEIIETPQNFFSSDCKWKFVNCNITHRLPRNVTEFVNKMFETDIVSQKYEGPKIKVVAPNPWRMGLSVIDFLNGNFDDTLLLVSTKNGNRPLKALANFLTSKNIPIHIGTNENNDEKLKAGKLRIVTFHSSKGMEAKKIIVVMGENEQNNPSFVALTRTKEEVLIILDPKKPNYEICKACRICSDIVEMDNATKKIVASESISRPPTQKVRPAPPQRSLQRARPRLSIYENFNVKKESFKVFDNEYDFTVLTREQLYEDTSRVYQQAVVFYVEYSRTNKIRYVEDLLNPTRIDYDQQTNAIKMGMMNRFVYPNIPSEALLPHDLYAIAEQSYFSSSSASDFCKMALASLSWDDFHYVMRQLLPVENWIDEGFFENVCEKALSLIPEDETAIYDVRLKYDCGEQVLHLRTNIYTDACVIHLVWNNELSQYNRGDAAIRAAMHPKKSCKLINILSGEMETITTQNIEGIISSI